MIKASKYVLIILLLISIITATWLLIPDNYSARQTTQDTIQFVSRLLENKKMHILTSIRQFKANIEDVNKDYHHSARDIFRMQENPNLCFKNTDCQQICVDACKPAPIQKDCNRSNYEPGIFNKYSVPKYRMMTLMKCPEVTFGFAVCSQNVCKWIETGRAPAVF